MRSATSPNPNGVPIDYTLTTRTSTVRASIWTIPHLTTLPTEQIELLQVLSDLLPFKTDLRPDDQWATKYPDRARARRLLQVEDWTADAARQGLLRWPERDALIRRLHDAAQRP